MCSEEVQRFVQPRRCQPVIAVRQIDQMRELLAEQVDTDADTARNADEQGQNQLHVNVPCHPTIGLVIQVEMARDATGKVI